MQSDESDSSSLSTVDLSASFNTPQLSNKWRPHNTCHFSNLMRQKPYAQKIRKRRKPVLIKNQASSQKYLRYNHPMPSPKDSNDAIYGKIISEINTFKQKEITTVYKQREITATFKRREITTIYEEVYQCSKVYHNRISKPRGYQEKVASLKSIVNRLQKMCLEKPEVLQNTIPDETIKRFKAIHI